MKSTTPLVDFKLHCAALMFCAWMIAPCACAEDAAAIAQKGFDALNGSQSEPKLIVTAAREFVKASALFEKEGNPERAVEMNSYLYWCKKKMTMADIDSFIKAEDKDSGERLTAVDSKKIDPANAAAWFEKAETFAREAPNQHLLIAVRFYEIADRFKGSDISLKAQDRSLSEMQKFSQNPPANTGAAKPASSAPAAADGNPLPVPDTASQRQAEKLIAEIFKEDLLKTKPEELSALADKFMDQAAQSKDDPAARYVLLRQSIDLAAKTPDLLKVLTLTAKLSAQFKVDLPAVKKEALAVAGSRTRDPELSKSISAAKILQDKPDDPVQNQILGRGIVLLKDPDWNMALPYFAKSGNAAIKKLALAELAVPADAPAMEALADGWWEVAEKEPLKDLNAACQKHAAAWYSKALPQLTALSKIKAEKRVESAQPSAAALVRAEPGKSKSTEPKPISSSEMFAIEGNVINAVSVTSDKRLPAGNYKMVGSANTTGNNHNIKITLDEGVVLETGTFMINCKLICNGTAEKPVILRNVAISLMWNGSFEAAYTIFDKCRFDRVAGTYTVGGYSTKWSCKNCIFNRLTNNATDQLYCGLHYSNCVFSGSTLPEIRINRPRAGLFDHMTYLRTPWETFEGCSFFDCTIAPTIFFCATKANYFGCKFLGGEAYDSDDDLVVDPYIFQGSGKLPDIARRKPVKIAQVQKPYPPPDLPKEIPIPELQPILRLLKDAQK